MSGFLVRRGLSAHGGYARRLAAIAGPRPAIRGLARRYRHSPIRAGFFFISIRRPRVYISILFYTSISYLFYPIHQCYIHSILHFNVISIICQYHIYSILTLHLFYILTLYLFYHTYQHYIYSIYQHYIYHNFTFLFNLRTN